MKMLKVSISPHIHAKPTTASIMRDVLISLAPAAVAAIVFYGLRAVVTMLVTVAAAVASEWVCNKVMKRDVTIFDGSAAVTGLLLAFCLPTGAPWWLGVAGAVFAIVLAKQMFGGLGHNFVNPALAGRAFLLASWPALMTSYRTPMAVDAVSGATPLAGGEASLWELFSGMVPGAFGEVCKLAVLIGGVYLIVRQVIDWRIPLAYIGGVALFSFIFGQDPLIAVLSGGVMMAGFFMLTDYVTSPATAWGRVIFGLGAALITVLIRVYGAYPEGVTYAVLFMNVAAPLIERYTQPRIFGG